MKYLKQPNSFKFENLYIQPCLCKINNTDTENKENDNINQAIEFMEYPNEIIDSNVSRSSTIAIAYLMRQRTWTMLKSIDHVKKCRELTQFEKELFSVTNPFKIY